MPSSVSHRPPNDRASSRDLRRLARESSTSETLRRWLLACAAVVFAHAALAWAMLAREMPDPLPAEPPPAVMIELAAMAVPVEDMPDDVAPGPQMTESVATPAMEARPVEAIEDARRVTDDEMLKPVPDEAATVAESTTNPTEETRTVQAEEAPQEKKQAQKKKPTKAAPAPAPRTTAPPKSRAQKSNRSAAPSAGASSSPSISPARWRSALMAHLNRHKRSPRGGGVGTATVRFTINRSGRVTSVRLARSSGNKSLDAAAVSLVRRASPVPRPPASVGGNSITLSVPVRFKR